MVSSTKKQRWMEGFEEEELEDSPFYRNLVEQLRGGIEAERYESSTRGTEAYEETCEWLASHTQQPSGDTNT